MAQERKIKAVFNADTRYFMNSLGNEFHFTSCTGPYEYLLGALSGCFYSTLCSFDRKSSWQSLEIEVRGIKRDTVPTTLEKTTLDITVFKAEDRAEFESLVAKASMSCSIFKTLEAVSKMDVVISYED